MAEKNWNEMDGWEKAWEVTKVVWRLVLIALPFLFDGKAAPKPRPPTIWKPKFYPPNGGPKGWKY